MRLRWTIACCWLTLVPFAAASAQEETFRSRLIGVWELVKGSSGAPEEATVEFTSGGQLFLTGKVKDMPFKVEGTYKLEGRKLFVTMRLGEKTHSETMTIRRLSDTSFITVDEKGKVDEFKRRGGK